MQDDELKKLNAIEVPKASKKAKSLALSASMQAFDEENSHISEKNQKNLQGFSKSHRPIDIINQKIWSFIMKKQLVVGTALAGVVAVMIGLPMLEDSKPFISKEKKSEQIEEQQTNKNVLKPSKDTDSYKESKVAEQEIKSEQVDSDFYDDSANEMAQPDIEAINIARPKLEKKAVSPNALPTKMAGSIHPSGQALSADSRSATRLAQPIPPSAPYPGEGVSYIEQQNNDKFTEYEFNAIKKVTQEPVSTISVDVDTASYSYVRKSLNNGRNINKNSVRVEELINYFDYKYPYPESSSVPFKPTMSIFPTPWNEETKLLHIGIKGYDIVAEEKPKSNLVFLIDVSGSMNNQNKLPLLKNSLRMLVNTLNDDDLVSIVTYAGYAGTALTPTPVSEKEKILSTLENLKSGGSTAGAQGIRQAYALAEQNFDKAGVNRVLLATDGDFNVGVSSNADLKKLIEEKRKSGIFLSILGFGQGNYNDSLMQTLAQNGNGNAAYIDTLNEARKVLVDEASSTLFPIAKDVKIQIEFNPALVSEYRLIGYETRKLNREDFNNDKVDAGDIGAGHTVTAIYEITPIGSSSQMIDDLRYGQNKTAQEAVITKANNANEYAFLKMRYKLPNEDTSKLVEIPVTKDMEHGSIEQTSTEVRFSTSVAAFGQKIRKEDFVSSYSYKNIINLAQGAKGEDKFGYRTEFINLVRIAKSLNN
jgi:Ca-activated chloride channel family protein